MGILLAQSQFWSVSGSKNNTNKESDPLSAPKCRQEVYRRDILPQLDSIRDTFTDLRWNFASPWQLVGIAQFEQSKSSLSLRNSKQSEKRWIDAVSKTFHWQLVQIGQFQDRARHRLPIGIGVECRSDSGAETGLHSCRDKMPHFQKIYYPKYSCTSVTSGRKRILS